MNKYIQGNKMIEGEIPEHLQGLSDEIGKIYYYAMSEEEYADIAFKLIAASNGDKKAMADVVAYIQKQHRQIQEIEERYENFIKTVVSWIYWAKNWTMRKPSKTS